MRSSGSHKNPRATLAFRKALAESRVLNRRLEQLHRIPRRILDQDLLTAHTGDDVIAESHTSLAQSRDELREIVHLDRKAVPTARLWHSAVGHRSSAAALRIRHAEDQAQIAARQHRKRRRGMHVEMKAEMRRVKRDRGVDVANDVADLNRGHLDGQYRDIT